MINKSSYDMALIDKEIILTCCHCNQNIDACDSCDESLIGEDDIMCVTEGDQHICLDCMPKFLKSFKTEKPPEI